MEQHGKPLREGSPAILGLEKPAFSGISCLPAADGDQRKT